DDRVIAPLSRERIERRRRGFVWGVLFADLDGADGGISKADIAVAAEQGAVDLIAQIAVGLSVARKRGNVESGFELIDEAPIAVRQFLEAAHAEIGYVCRDVRHPAKVPAGSDDAIIIELFAKVIHVQGAGKKSGDGLGGGVKRHVELAI